MKQIQNRHEPTKIKSRHNENEDTTTEIIKTTNQRKQMKVRKKDILQKLISPVSAKNKYYWLLKHLMLL